MGRILILLFAACMGIGADFGLGPAPGGSADLSAPGAIGGGTPATSVTAERFGGANTTLTADAPQLNLSQTWNNAGVTFTHSKVTVTDTASAAGSLFLDLRLDAASKFAVAKTGAVTAGDDTDLVFRFGRVGLGYDGTNADIAYFSHRDNLNQTDYSVLQTAAGATVVNAKTGQTIQTRINNANRMTIATNAITVVNGVPVTVQDATAAAAPGTGALIVSAGGFSVTQGNISFNGNTGQSLRVLNPVANAAVATTLGSVGPTGANAGNPLGWLRISVNGTDRYIPFW